MVNLKPHKDPDEFIKALGAEEFEKRLEQAMDSFMFRVHMAEREFPMEEPQDRTVSLSGVRRCFWSFPMNWREIFI